MKPSEYIESWEEDHAAESFVYEDEGDDYVHPERKFENEVLRIRLYCNYDGCNKYVIGHEGYNGGFLSEDGQRVDLRNQYFLCKNHRGTTIMKEECF